MILFKIAGSQKIPQIAADDYSAQALVHKKYVVYVQGTLKEEI